MALVFAPGNFQQQREVNGAPTGIPHAGNSAVGSIGTTSTNLALPVDGASKPYNAVLITATIPAWVAFCSSGSDTVTAATAPAFLVAASAAPVLLAVPPGATNVAFIDIDASSTGKISFLGIY